MIHGAVEVFRKIKAAEPSRVAQRQVVVAEEIVPEDLKLCGLTHIHDGVGDLGVGAEGAIDHPSTFSPPPPPACPDGPAPSSYPLPSALPESGRSCRALPHPSGTACWPCPWRAFGGTPGGKVPRGAGLVANGATSGPDAVGAQHHRRHRRVLVVVPAPPSSSSATSTAGDDDDADDADGERVVTTMTG